MGIFRIFSNGWNGYASLHRGPCHPTYVEIKFLPYQLSMFVFLFIFASACASLYTLFATGSIFGEEPLYQPKNSVGRSCASRHILRWIQHRMM